MKIIIEGIANTKEQVRITKEEKYKIEISKRYGGIVSVLCSTKKLAMQFLKRNCINSVQWISEVVE